MYDLLQPANDATEATTGLPGLPRLSARLLGQPLRLSRLLPSATSIPLASTSDCATGPGCSKLCSCGD